MASVLIMELIDYFYMNALFATAWLCTAAFLVAGLFAFMRYRQLDRYFMLPTSYALASLAAAVFLISVGMIRLAYHFEQPDDAVLYYRLALAAAPLCGFAYIFMHVLLLEGEARLWRRSLAVLGGLSMLAALLPWLPAPLGMFASPELVIVDYAMRADYSPMALVYFPIPLLLVGYLVVTVMRGALRLGRHRPFWTIHSVALAILAATPVIDMLREAGILLFPFPVSWAGFALFHLSAAGVFATTYADLLERNEVHSREIRRLSHELIHDDLTRLHSRRYIDAMIHERLGERKGPDSGALLFIDLDDFKAVNDIYGHQAGDALLVAIARQIERVLRQGDVAARWGGDEFLVFLPGTGKEAAMQVAERLGEAVRNATVHAGGRDVRVTASIGYAPLTEDAVAAADLALFQAKADGKDRAAGGP